MRMRLQHIRHKPREQQIATNRCAEFIKHDAAIRVAIETETCVKLAAANVLEANTVAAELIVTAPRRVVKSGVTPPTAPVKVTVPAPAVKARA